jgi:DNA-directed RNA polymerase specialized sigma24 family protein
MTAETQLEIISKKLSLLAALYLLPDTSQLSKSDQVAMLSRFGLSSEEVATILGTTKGTVDVLKSRLKSNKNRKK